MGTPSTNVTAQYPGKSIWVTSGSFSQDQTISGALIQLPRIQSTSFTIPYPLQDNVYLDSSVESFNLSPAGVNFDINYYHTAGRQELYLGLAKVTSSGNLILGLDEEKDLYIAAQNNPGVDSIGAPAGSPQTVLGLGQAVMTSYELAAQVGGLIEGRASMNALTAVVYTGFSGVTVPSIQYQDGSSRTGRFIIPPALIQYNPAATGMQGLLEGAPALGARDMVLMFPQQSPFGVVYTGVQAVYLQSFNLSLTIDRQEQKPLGYAYPIARQIMYPIRVDLSTNALVSRMQADRLDRLACTTTGFTINLAVKQPCTNATVFGFYLNNLQVVSQNFGQQIGGVDTVSTTWRGWIKTPQDVVFNPWVQWIVDLSTTGAWGTTW